MCEKGKGAFKWPSLRLRLGWHTDSGRLLLEYAEAGKRQGETDTGPGGSLDPPEPLPTRFHAVYMEYSERLPTLSNPLAERACFLPGKRGAHVRSWDVLSSEWYCEGIGRDIGFKRNSLHSLSLSAHVK